MKKSLLTAEARTVLEEYGLDFSALQDGMLFHYDSGETILDQGTPVQSLFILLNGKVMRSR